MSHYAKVKDGIVLSVIVSSEDFLSSFTLSEGESWVQTSYNTVGGKHYGQDGNEDKGTPLRANYAGVGYTYNKTRDAFIPARPYPSWLLNESTCNWNAPVAMPDDDKAYAWNETDQTWDEVDKQTDT